jgi:hypothetical protein
MKLISTLLLTLLLALPATAHASDAQDGQGVLGANDTLLLWQDVMLVASNDDRDEDEHPDDPGEHSDRDRDRTEDHRDKSPDDDREHSDRDKDRKGDKHDESQDDDSEHSGHDKDRKGAKKNKDKDGDGFSNRHEKLAGSDPKDANSVPADMDGDFIPDVIDPDIDGDGVPNGQDMNPTAPTVTADLTAPVITVPAAVTAEATGLNTIVAMGAATAIDNIDAIVAVISDAPVSYPVGTTTVTYSATDAAGNTSTATQTVTVVDTTAPVISVPVAVTLISTDGGPVQRVIGQATATDAFAVTITNDAPATFPVGTTTVTWTATDANGNISTATQLVIVTANIADTTPPVITVPADITAEATDINTSVTLGTATATDNVDGAVGVTSDAPATFPLGATTVTYSAADAAGNTATATQLVTVVDTTMPVVTAPADATGISGDGQPITVAIGQATATDAFTVTITNDAPATFPVGNTTVTWTATDANGNSATATQLVTVTNATAAFTFIAPPDLVLQTASASGIPASQVTFGQPTIQSTVAVSWSRSYPQVFPIGISQATWKATDANGNVINAIQLVTVTLVQDTTPPVISAPADIQVTSIDGNPVPVSLSQPTATDDMGQVTLTNDAPATFPIGTTTVTWTATDSSGNSSTATQLVVVIWDQQYLANLPPDPGPAGELTLEGIDSDFDGVRDDVQRWIALTYPNSQKTREALIQGAKARQKTLVEAADPVSSHKNAIQGNRALECLSYIRPDDFDHLLTESKAIFLNTYLRSKAWLQADKHLSGSMFSLLPDPKTGCNFNPDALLN